MIENHQYFLDKTYQVNKALEIAIETALVKEPLPLLFPAITNIYAPNPGFNALFLARHMVNHLQNGVGLRHLTDWSLFLKNFSQEIDWNQTVALLDQQKMLPAVAILTQICVDYLGLPVQCTGELLSQKPDVNSCAFVFEHITAPKFSRLQKHKSLVPLVIYKTRRLFYQRKLHRLIQGEPFTKALMRSSLRLIKHPADALKSR